MLLGTLVSILPDKTILDICNSEGHYKCDLNNVLSTFDPDTIVWKFLFNENIGICFIDID